MRRGKWEGGRGVILGILGGGVPPGSPNPDPISDQKVSLIFHTHFQTWPLKSIPILRPVLKEIMSSILRLGQQPKRYLKIPFELPISLSFLLIWN